MTVDRPACPLSRRAFLSACLGLLGSALLPSRVRAGQEEELLLLGRVLDGTGAPPIEDGAVVLRAGRIVAVGQRQILAVPKNIPLLDLRPWTLLPGIINAHAHRVAPPSVRRELLLAGVTSVGDVGSPLEDIRELRLDRTLTGDRVATALWTGPMFGPPGGYPGRLWPSAYGIEATDADQARRQAEILLDRGASMLKIAFEPGSAATPWPVLGLAEARAVVKVAHGRGAVVRCHVQDLSGLPLALAAGVDAVEHTLLSSRSVPVFIGERGRLAPCPEYRELLRRMAGQGVTLVPTLEIGVRSTWDASGALSAVRLFHEAGGQVALGTDAPLRGIALGMPLREMDLLARAGLTPMQVIQAATSRAAMVVAQGDRLGTIEAGKNADIIAVAGDPLNALPCLGDARAVVKDGEVILRDET
ncbi:MAG: amidohydrolase family protein [Proteobacteria bacterium]|nr:amidohydrolase family protein [Pseudomonadota bacterium]MBU1612054.1 amidohydrolase family protein [Pseudomonadota bacterium]